MHACVCYVCMRACMYVCVQMCCVWVRECAQVILAYCCTILRESHLMAFQLLHYAAPCNSNLCPLLLPLPGQFHTLPVQTSSLSPPAYHPRPRNSLSLGRSSSWRTTTSARGCPRSPQPYTSSIWCHTPRHCLNYSLTIKNFTPFIHSFHIFFFYHFLTFVSDFTTRPEYFLQVPRPMHHLVLTTVMKFTFRNAALIFCILYSKHS